MVTDPQLQTSALLFSEKVSPFSRLKLVWVKAAMIGSLWGAVEIILGSFFHNIGFPLVGTVLSSIGVILMVAGQRMWNEKGLLWKAGLIAALLKSVSPSAVILGPMLCIFLEALLMQLAVILAGRNLVGFLLGGMLAVSVTLFYKIGSLMITFGNDAVVIYNNMYRFAMKQLGTTASQPRDLIYALAAIYAVTGIIAALIGYFTGKKAKDFQLNSTEVIAEEGKQKSIGKFSLIALLLHFICVVMGLVSLYYFPLVYAGPAVFVYLIIAAIHYKQATRRLLKPMLWIQLLLLSITSILFIRGASPDNSFSMEAGVAVLSIALRALLMIIGFSAISVELRNPKIAKWFMQKKRSQIYLAVGMGFEALPHMIAELSEPKKILKNPSGAFGRLIEKAASMLPSYENRFVSVRPVVIISGERNEGKTTFLTNAIKILKEKNIPLHGFLAPKIREGENVLGYKMISISSGEEMILSLKEERAGWVKEKIHYFNPQAIEFGKEILTGKNAKEDALLIIDEVGLFELAGNLWADSLNKLVSQSGKPMIWVVRKEFISRVTDRWGINNVTIIDVAKTTPEQAAEVIGKL
ncbi:MAG: nucleoside-triphosphatase [Bacteroidota bacterium]